GSRTRRSARRRGVRVNTVRAHQFRDQTPIAGRLHIAPVYTLEQGIQRTRRNKTIHQLTGGTHGNGTIAAPYFIMRGHHHNILSPGNPIHKQLDTLDGLPAGLDVHVIADNYATHKHAAVRAWIGTHPRFHMRYTPTSSSWLNQVGHWFGDLDRDAIRRGVFPSLQSLVDSIDQYIDAHNRNPRPYTWTASAETILAKVKHAKDTLNHSTNCETDH
ncbi:transposase, partial [Bifidobacterium reuteri DSM 23975]